ncbi:MAG: c-type cytochrome [Gammaproteobacteria bacterium]|nr:c-type cytochrome [Gammaproteobacteria bacterium]
MIRKMSFILGLAAIVAASGGAFAAGGDPKEGAVKSALCHGCHGENGQSIAPNFPNLAGQKPGYIFKQVTDFKNNHRYNDTMSPMALTVASNQDLKDIAAYFSTQKSMTAMIPGSDGKLLKQGETIFASGNPKTGLYGCVNCHGKNGKGKSGSNQVFPVIGGQNKDYLVAQLTTFRSGERKNDPAGMMGDIAKRLSDAEIEAVSEYLSSL